MWTSASSGPLEPNYTSIEELFALPKTDGPAKATGPPAKPKEVHLTGHLPMPFFFFCKPHDIHWAVVNVGSARVDWCIVEIFSACESAYGTSP